MSGHGQVYCLLWLDLDPVSTPRVSLIGTVVLLDNQSFSPEKVISVAFSRPRICFYMTHLVSRILSNIARISLPVFPRCSSANSKRPLYSSKLLKILPDRSRRFLSDRRFDVRQISLRYRISKTLTVRDQLRFGGEIIGSESKNQLTTRTRTVFVVCFI